MKNHTIATYNFAELSDSAKEKAHNEYLNRNWDQYELEDVFESAAHFFGFFNIEIEQNRYNESFDFVGDRRRVAHEAGRDISVNYLKKWRKYSDAGASLTDGYFVAETLSDGLINDMRNGLSFKDAMDNCLDEFNGIYEKENEYLNSLEYFAEIAEANDWQFLENGKWYF